MLLASNFTKNELLHRYFSWILISNLGTPISRNTSKWMLLFAKLLKRKRSTLSIARYNFIECALFLIVDKVTLMERTFFKCRHFREENFFCKRPFFKMLFIWELCPDKEPEVPRNNVNNNSITDTWWYVSFFIFDLFLFFCLLFLRGKAKTKKIWSNSKFDYYF